MATHLVQIDIEVTATGPSEDDDVREIAKKWVLLLTPMQMLPASLSAKIAGASVDGKPLSPT